MQAKNAVIWGKIYSGEGQIGGWNISGTGISASNIKINNNGSIETVNYSEDYSGWKITGSGSAYFNSGKIAGWTMSITDAGRKSELYSQQGTVKVGLASTWTGETNNKFFYLTDSKTNLFYIKADGSEYIKQIIIEPKAGQGNTSRITLGDAGNGSGATGGGISVKDSFGQYVEITPGSVKVCSNVTGGTSTMTYKGDGQHPSDKRLKNNIKNFNPFLAKHLHPVCFNFTENPKIIRYGFIAQEVQKVMPEVVG